MTKKEIYIFLVVITIGVSIICITKINAKDKIIKLSIPLKEKMATSKEIVAELSIENSDFKTQIVQADDNIYYLNHNIEKEEDIIGTPFLDYRNDLNDKKIIIYGQNSQTITTPFHILEKYLEKDYYKNHNIVLESKTKEIKYQVIAIIIDTNEEFYEEIKYQEEDYSKHIEELIENSIYDTNIKINTTDQILLLKTNYYNPKDSNLIIVAKSMI